MRMADDKEELENGRMFREVCSLNGPLRGRILPTTPTSLYEHFKQSTFEEPTTVFIIFLMKIALITS